MRDPRATDPVEVVLAREAVEELLSAVPEGSAKDVLRLVAAGLSAQEIAGRLGLAVGDVQTLTARGRIRVLTAAVGGRPAPARRARTRVRPGARPPGSG